MRIFSSLEFLFCRPRRVAALQGKKVVAIATGSLHCVACTDQGGLSDVDDVQDE